MSESPAMFKEHCIPVDILDEIAARFIVNLNNEERQDTVRICFQLEEAHWFYIDFYVNKQPHRNLQSGSIRTFAEHMFNHVPFLRKHMKNLDKILEEWRAYKLSVPTYGSIILNTCLDKVLLVQGFWTKASWGFPKGKINQDEETHVCAAREVLEETGYDISEKIDPDCFIETQIHEQFVRLYIVTGVQENTNFQTRTRCEIKDIRWFDINTLPLNKSDQNCKERTGFNATSFYMVIPFVNRIKQFIAEKNWERLQFQDDDAKGRNKKKSDTRKTPSAFTHHILYHAPDFNHSDRSGDKRSEGKNLRRQLFDEQTNMSSPNTYYSRNSTSRESTPAKQSIYDGFTRLTPQQQANLHKNSQHAKKIIKPVPQKPNSRNNVFSHTEPLLAGFENAPKNRGQIRVRDDIYQQPMRNEENISYSGRREQGDDGLIPKGFCPSAWKNFSIDMDEVLRICIEDSTNNQQGLKKRRPRRKSTRK